MKMMKTIQKSDIEHFCTECVFEWECDWATLLKNDTHHCNSFKPFIKKEVDNKHENPCILR